MQSLPFTTRSPARESCAHAVLDSVPPVIWFIRRHMRAHRKGLSLPQFRALVIVDRQPATSLSTLAEHLASSLPTASRIAAGLVKKGLLTRSGCREDRRQLALAITPAGQVMLDGAWASTHQQMEEQLGRISPEQRATIVAAMNILRGLFGTMGLPAAAVANGSPGSTRAKRRRRSRAAAVRNRH